jgi:hypothetical protein
MPKTAPLILTGICADILAGAASFPKAWPSTPLSSLILPGLEGACGEGGADESVSGGVHPKACFQL